MKKNDVEDTKITKKWKNVYCWRDVLSSAKCQPMKTNCRYCALLTVMPPASYAGRRPFCFTAVVYIFSFLFSPPNLRGRLADRHQTLPQCSTVIQIYKIRSKIWMVLPPWDLAAQNIKISLDFAHLRDLIANIFGTQQDIVNQKKDLIRFTLVH